MKIEVTCSVKERVAVSAILGPSYRQIKAKETFSENVLFIINLTNYVVQPQPLRQNAILILGLIAFYKCIWSHLLVKDLKVNKL